MVRSRSIDLWTVMSTIAVLLLISVLILQPVINRENILTALRVSAATTATPFLLLFALTPFDRPGSAAHTWLAGHRAETWLILTASHLLHLAQIGLYYRLGGSCPLTVWLVTLPVWLVMVAVTLSELGIGPRFAASSEGRRPLYAAGLWIVWLVFLLAFALGTAAGHLMAFNLPALVLYLAAAVGWFLPRLGRGRAAVA